MTDRGKYDIPFKNPFKKVFLDILCCQKVSAARKVENSSSVDLDFKGLNKR